MGFTREWDASCPRVWDSWQGEDGAAWVIRDLRPEDDERAVAILMEDMCRDDVLCSLSDVLSDPESVSGAREFWRTWLAQRMSLGCYLERGGDSRLVALNVCIVVCRGEEPDYVIKGKAWNNVFGAIKACGKVDAFELLGADRLLFGLGLVVQRQHRGARLGARILAAREGLTRHVGVGATSTVFTGPASQASAARAGFSTALVVTLQELADAGLAYPRDPSRALKLMVKKYAHHSPQ